MRIRKMLREGEGPARTADARAGEWSMQGVLSASLSRARERMPRRRRLVALMVAVLCIAGAGEPRYVAAQADADKDKDYVEPLVNKALETQKSGVAVPWSNPATGSSGTITIERTFYRDPRAPCRDYRRTLERAGAPKVQIEGTGCRIGPGRWSLDEEKPKTGAAGAVTPGATAAPPLAGAAAPAPKPAAAPAPASCPAPKPAPVACAKPPAVAGYTMPPRTEL
jgi:surface antigen